MLHVVKVPPLASILQLQVVGILVLFASLTVTFPENINILSFLSVCLNQGCDFVLSLIIFQEIPSETLAA